MIDKMQKGEQLISFNVGEILMTTNVPIIK